MAGAVELFCSVKDRRSQCLVLILCDDQNRVVHGLNITAVPAEPGAEHAALVLAPVAGALRELGGSVLVVRGKPRNRVTDADRHFHQQLLERCREEGIGLLGFYVAGPTSVRRMPDPPVVPV